MNKDLVLIGGGHAHMVTLANLNNIVDMGHRVTVIGPSDYHYYSGMGPGMMGKTYTPEDIRFATRHVVEKQGGNFILGKAVRIDPGKKCVYTDTDRTIPYDVLSCNAGSHVSDSIALENKMDIFTVKPIERLLEAQARIINLVNGNKNLRIGIVGGGPSAAEISGNIWRLSRDYCKRIPDITIFAGKKFMSRFPSKVRNKIIQSLSGRGIGLIEKGYVKEIKKNRIVLDTGETHGADFIMLATGVRPSPIFTESGIQTGPDGGLLVNQYLQSIQYPEIFGGGDCIYFQDQPLDKVGVYAVRENPVLYHNILVALNGGKMKRFEPGGDYLLIFNMGDGTGVFKKNRLVFGGRPAFMLKDYIDRKFIRKFQSIE